MSRPAVTKDASSVPRQKFVGKTGRRWRGFGRRSCRGSGCWQSRNIQIAGGPQAARRLWSGWRTRAFPRWLSTLGGLTSLVLLAGVTGMSGLEVLAGPWLIAADVWMLTRSHTALQTS
jgi:hypothetical protein